MAFREQTAGHNALLLLVALSHELLEERLRNAFLDVHARAAEVRALSSAPPTWCMLWCLAALQLSSNMCLEKQLIPTQLICTR